MSAVETVTNMINTLTASLADAEKHDKGVDAAGARLRKTAQTVANECKDFRKGIQEERNTRKG